MKISSLAKSLMRARLMEERQVAIKNIESINIQSCYVQVSSLATFADGKLTIVQTAKKAGEKSTTVTVMETEIEFGLIKLFLVRERDERVRDGLHPDRRGLRHCLCSEIQKIVKCKKMKQL